MKSKTHFLERRYFFPFFAVTALFALWGFANDITNPLVAAFGTVMEISQAKASLVQFAFYGGYATMAIPAALFIRKYSYKSGILLGLFLYAFGAFLFLPAARCQSFGFFCISLYILTFGLAFLETTANPFILSLGRQETATRRLNFAQAFNPIGSLAGMFVASRLILGNLGSDVRDAAGNLLFHTLPEAEKAAIRTQDLALIRNPYLCLGLVVAVFFLCILCMKMPQTTRTGDIRFKATCRRLFSRAGYREGVLTQLFYVAAQIMCWTFIIQYADHLGIDKATAQLYNIGAMCLFLCGRFVSTFLMKWLKPEKTLLCFAFGAIACILGAIVIEGMAGLWCLVFTSAFMAPMFPTIYGISLEKVGDDATLGAAFLVMAIVGGSIMPPLQGMIIDLGQVAGHPAVNFSFILPLLSFVVIAVYSARSIRRAGRQAAPAEA